MAERVVDWNGVWRPESEARVSIYDLSVMQAAAAFEMTRSFGGVSFKVREHLLRLMASCRLLRMPCPWSLDYLTERCLACQAANQPAMRADDEHRLLIVVSPGCAPMYRDVAGALTAPWYYIADFPLRWTTHGLGCGFTEGVPAVTSVIRQVPDACVPSQAKHRSRLHFHLAQQRTPAGIWPVLVSPVSHADGTTDDYVTEAPGANLVAVHQRRISVCAWNCLAGISAATVQTLVPTTRDTDPTLTWISQADELWLTGTPFCMLPVVNLDGQPIGEGRPGPVYRETLAKWNALVGLDIAGQIAAWDSAASPN